MEVLKAPSELRSRTMRAVKSKNTSPEMVVRRLVHRLGYRYRLHREDLLGKPDLVFSGKKKVIFVHGCFWHGHECVRGSRIPKTNKAYWERKISQNWKRDQALVPKLFNMGWESLIVWECEIKNYVTTQKKDHPIFGNGLGYRI